MAVALRVLDADEAFRNRVVDETPATTSLVFCGHGCVGTLLKCHLGGRPIRLEEDQRRMAAPGGGNDDAPVAATEIDEMIAGPDVRQIEHALNQGLRRRPEGYVEMVGRAGPRAAYRLEGAILRVACAGHGRRAIEDPFGFSARGSASQLSRRRVPGNRRREAAGTRRRRTQVLRDRFRRSSSAI